MGKAIFVVSTDPQDDTEIFFSKDYIFKEPTAIKGLNAIRISIENCYKQGLVGRQLPNQNLQYILE